MGGKAEESEVRNISEHPWTCLQTTLDTYIYSLPSTKTVTLLVGLPVSISWSPLNLLLFFSDLRLPVTKNSNKLEESLQKTFFSKFKMECK